MARGTGSAFAWAEVKAGVPDGRTRFACRQKEAKGEGTKEAVCLIVFWRPAGWKSGSFRLYGGHLVENSERIKGRFDAWVSDTCHSYLG